MKISRQVGTVSEVLNIYIQDVSVSTGAGLANVVASSVSYGILRNNQATVSTGTLSTSTGALGLYFASTLTQASSTSALGWYQLGVPNFVFASGSSSLLHLYGAPNMVPLPIEIELTKTNNQQYTSSTIFSSTNTIAAVNGPVGVSTLSTPVGVSSTTVLHGVSTLTIPIGVSSIAIPVSVSSVTDKGNYGVSSISIPVSVSSGTWLAGVSSVTIPVSVSSGTWLVGVSTVTDKSGYSLDAIYGAAGAISTNIAFVAGLAVTGDGTSSVPWGP